MSNSDIIVLFFRPFTIKVSKSFKKYYIKYNKATGAFLLPDIWTPPYSLIV